MQPQPIVIDAPHPPPDQCGNPPSSKEQNKRAGRPCAFSVEKREHFCSLIRMGCRRGAAAKMVGLSRHTVRRALRRDPELAARVQQAEFEAASRFLRHINEAANTHWRAAAWIHEQRHKPHQRTVTVRKLVRSREFEAAVARVVAGLEVRSVDGA